MLNRQERNFPRQEQLSGYSAAVLGFPRSGNTFLIAWLQYMSKGHMKVLDGRCTHSALDLITLDKAKIPTLIPVRNPEDTIASFLVRADAYDDVKFAHNSLRSITAWYRTAERVLPRASLFVVTFETISADLNSLLTVFPEAHYFDPERLVSGNEGAKAWLEEQLRDVEGQGLPQNGVPAEQMASLPRAERAGLNSSARDILKDESLEGVLVAAQSAHDRFLRRARSLSKCL